MAWCTGGALGSKMTAVAVDSVDAVRDRIVDAGHRRIGLRVVGSGTWLDAGRPVRSTETISTRELTGITEYVPGDLTLSARAGTTLAEIRDATREHGQWLAMDPPGSSEGTIGATVATSSAGPLRTYFGSPRDLTLGVEFVSGVGVVARGGGRVVKNVAGFDLTRLMTGSWGTLGVITEVTVRLHARPEADESVAIVIDATMGAARVRQLLRRLPFMPYACEVVNPTLDSVIGSSETTALLRLAGNSEGVRAQRQALAELGGVRPVDPSVWTKFAAIEPEGSIVFRLSGLPTEIEARWRDASEIAAECPGTLLHASPSRGVVRCIVPKTDAAVASLKRRFAAPSQGSRIGERLPAELWQLCSPAPTADRLSAGIKRAFDPSNVLNVGIFGESA
jgi:glycolate oxidase FAD binding subunit